MSKTSQLLVMIAAMCWGVIGIFSRQLVAAGFSFVEIAAARGLITSVCLFAFLLITDRKKMKISIKDLWIFIVMGGVGVAMFNIFYFRTLETITMSATTILLYTSPFIVMVISAFAFNDKITKQKVAAVMIAFAGCLMTVGIAGGGDMVPMGIITGLAAAFCYSQYTIFGKFALKKYSPVTIPAYAFGIVGVILGPFCDWGKMFALLSEDSGNTANLLILGLCLTLLPFICYTNALKRIEASKAMIIAFVEIPTAAVAGMLVFNETLTLLKVAGIALVFVAVVVLNMERKI